MCLTAERLSRLQTGGREPAASQNPPAKTPWVLPARVHAAQAWFSSRLLLAYAHSNIRRHSPLVTETFDVVARAL
jgi:hypothetical protein